MKEAKAEALKLANERVKVAGAALSAAIKAGQLAGGDAAVDPSVQVATEEVAAAKAAKAEVMKMKVK